VPYTGSSGIPDIVEKSAERRFDDSKALRHIARGESFDWLFEDSCCSDVI
jgi:hypothetical protein